MAEKLTLKSLKDDVDDLWDALADDRHRLTNLEETLYAPPDPEPLIPPDEPEVPFISVEPGAKFGWKELIIGLLVGSVLTGLGVIILVGPAK